MLAACITVACLGFVLRGAGARGAAAVSLAGGLLVLSFTLPRLREPIAAILELAERGGISEEVGVSLRVLSVGLLSALAADACRDLGEGSVADRLELFARAEILVLSLPFLLELLRLSLEVMG